MVGILFQLFNKHQTNPLIQLEQAFVIQSTYTAIPRAIQSETPRKCKRSCVHELTNIKMKTTQFHYNKKSMPCSDIKPISEEICVLSFVVYRYILHIKTF